MKRLICLLIVFFFAWKQTILALDAKFYANDDGADQLPLSASYRDSLRKLCTLLSTGGRLPQEHEKNKAKLKKMCQKLASDDDNIQKGAKEGLLPVALKSRIFVGIATLGGCYVMWTQRHVLAKFLSSAFRKKNILGRERNTDPATLASSETTDYIRAARLRNLARRQEAEKEE